jgi:prepilin-type N-terminal cleavage/methylation domain-containing protein
MDHAARPYPRPGFSLIELLVTIAIIAVLIGILLPTLPLARDAARRVACRATLRGIGQGVELYKNDHRAVFPVARYMPQPWLRIDAADFGLPPEAFEEFDASLPDRMANYLDGGADLWKCPGDFDVFAVEWADDQGNPRIGGTSYTYISGLGGRRLEESFFYERLGLDATKIPVIYDFDGNTYETEDGRLIPVDFFHATRSLLFADGHAGAYESVGEGS